MFGKTVKDLKGVGSTIGELFGLENAKNYPNRIGTTPKELITNQPNYRNGDWRASRGYQFSVETFDKASNTIIKDESMDWSPFLLQINPQEISQDEIFAIQVTPTFRGVVVEHQGVTIKDINISGTTGLSPNRAEGGSMPKSGNPVFQVGHSGFEEFHELRSYFRMYVEAKRQENKSSKRELRLVFSNFKDNEFLFVEPQKFSMKRSASKPHLYDYSISLKAIGVATPLKVESDKKWFEKADEALEAAQNYFDLAVKGINGGFAIISRFQRNLSATVLGPLQSVNQALNAIRGGIATNFGEFGITRRFVKDLDRELKSIEANFNDIIGKKSASYNKAIGRVSTAEATGTVVLTGLEATTTTTTTTEEETTKKETTERTPTDTEFITLNAIQAGKKACAIILAQAELYEKNIYETNSKVLDFFPNSGIKNPNSVSTSVILGGDNIQMIAMRELGDIDKFKDIIILNNLKPPYISQTGGVGVLKYGDKILIPKPNASGASSVVKNVPYNITKNMLQAEIDLGVDIRLTEDGDLALASNKDLDLVAGVDNFVQAIALKLYLEKKSLKRHPFIGTNLNLGSKLRSKGLSNLRKEILDSLGSDSRVESIPYIELRQEGGTIYANILIKMKEIEQPIPLPLTLNVG